MGTTALVGLAALVGLVAAGCDDEAAAPAAQTTVTVTASPAATSLSLRRVCDDFQWVPNPPSSDAVMPWSYIDDALKVVVVYADPTARAALAPLTAATNRAVVSGATPSDQRAYERYRSAYDGFVAACRTAGSTALR